MDGWMDGWNPNSRHGQHRLKGPRVNISAGSHVIRTKDILVRLLHKIRSTIRPDILDVFLPSYTTWDDPKISFIFFHFLYLLYCKLLFSYS